MMTTQTSSVSQTDLDNIHSDKSNARLVTLMTWFACVTLGIGVLLCLTNLNYFSDRNTWLMVGLGFMIGSVHIFVIGTAMGLVHKRKFNSNKLPFQE